MGIEKDVLRTLTKGSCTYEDLKEVFPGVDVAHILIKMEEKHLVENKEGAWFITEKGKEKITQKKMGYALIIPAICFFLLSAHFYMGYTDLYQANEQLLQEKTDADAQLSRISQQKETAEAEYNAALEELAAEQDTTSQLNTSYEETEESVEALKEELNHFECLERCTPNRFVTLDNAYVKAKVDTITAGLTTLQEKQVAVFNFVRDKIEYDQSIFSSGRVDAWEYPEDILKRGIGGFEDKYMLLLTMLRIAGTPPEHVKFIAGEVDGNDNWGWVEAYDGTTWWVLDPFEGYEFTTESKDQFYTNHTVVIMWWFNDTTYRKGVIT